MLMFTFFYRLAAPREEGKLLNVCKRRRENEKAEEKSHSERTEERCLDGTLCCTRIRDDPKLREVFFLGDENIFFEAMQVF